MSDELIDDHLEALGSSKSEYTIQQRAFILRRLAEWLDYGLAYAATEQINAFLLDLRRRGRARNTIWTYGYHIRQFYLWACKAGFLDGDPTAELDRPARPQGIPNPVTASVCSPGPRSTTSAYPRCTCTGYATATAP